MCWQIGRQQPAELLLGHEVQPWARDTSFSMSAVSLLCRLHLRAVTGLAYWVTVICRLYRRMLRVPPGCIQNGPRGGGGGGGRVYCPLRGAREGGGGWRLGRGIELRFLCSHKSSRGCVHLGPVAFDEAQDSVSRDALTLIPRAIIYRDHNFDDLQAPGNGFRPCETESKVLMFTICCRAHAASDHAWSYANIDV